MRGQLPAAVAVVCGLDASAQESSPRFWVCLWGRDDACSALYLLAEACSRQAYS